MELIENQRVTGYLRDCAPCDTFNGYDSPRRTAHRPGAHTMVNEMVFMMGLPAAGKSTVAARMFPDYEHIDPDTFKTRIAGYDPENAFLVHEQSMTMFESAFLRAVASRRGLFVIDGTGVNAEAMVRRMREAQAAGFITRLVYVTCPLAVSIERANARPRKVPEYVIREKAQNIATSFEIVSQYAERVQVVSNA